MQGVCVNIYNKFIVNFSTNSVLRKIHGILRRVSVYRELHYEQGKMPVLPCKFCYLRMWGVIYILKCCFYSLYRYSSCSLFTFDFLQTETARA